MVTVTEFSRRERLDITDNNNIIVVIIIIIPLNIPTP